MFEPKFFIVKVLQVGSKSTFKIGNTYKSRQPHWTNDFVVFNGRDNDGKVFGVKNVEVIKEITRKEFYE